MLHTWGQNLQHHPHVHCVVTGGGLSPDGSRWVACPRGFFLPVRVLEPRLPGQVPGGPAGGLRAGPAHVPWPVGSCWPTQIEFDRWLAASGQDEWVVYAKPPFGGPEQVLKYLARYTHRVAISNRRLVRMKDGRVTFRYKDYAQGGKRRTMELEATEFLRR